MSLNMQIKSSFHIKIVILLAGPSTNRGAAPINASTC